MGKKCVRWTKCVRTLVVAMLMGALPMAAAAQSGDPSTLPRLSVDGLQYVGGFRLPADSANGDSFSIGGRQMTFNPANRSLFVGSRAGRIAEVSIPTPVNSANVNNLPFASYLQPFSDPTEGRLSQISSDGASIDGLLVHGNRLIGTASIYYDALNTQRVSHYAHSLQLNQSSFSGWSSVWDAARTGYVSGAMAPVPAEWQAALGGPALTSQCCIPIVTRTSWGPSAFAFDPSQVGGSTTIKAQPLLYYTGDHQTLGNWNGSNPTYGATTNMGGMAIIAGTRTILYFGRNGVGPHCYGNGTSDPSLNGKTGPDGATWCYDPTAGGKGSHAYPYRYQVWAYDLNDFVAVKNGQKQPWEVMPYGVWPLTFPTDEPTVLVGGVGYDATTQTLYVSQLLADRDGYSYRPVIHAFQVNAAPSSNSAPLTAVTLDMNKPSPQQPNTAITFTATPSGGKAPHEYRWFVHNGTAWTATTAWTTSAQYTWAPSTSGKNYRVMVGVRNSGTTVEEPQASAQAPFEIAASTLPTDSGLAAIADGAVISSMTLAVNRVAPQLTMTPITFTATATGGVAPHEFKWLVDDGAGWIAVTGWSGLRTFTWTPSKANPNYRVGVWSRSAGNTKDEAEASASSPFAITAPVPVAISNVAVSSNKPSPQMIGSTITWAASATGGSGSLQYKWLIYDGSPTWTAVTGWTTSNTFTWTPTAANAGYRVGVWVRNGSSTKDEPEASAAADFTISSPVATGPVSAVALHVNAAAPQTVGSIIVASATVTGGAAPYAYKWFIYDGSGWNAVGGWTSSNTFTWKPTKADPNYQIGVWVKNASNSRDELEASATLPFPIR